MASAVVPAPPTEPVSAVSRITNMFFTPSKTFRDLPRNSSWWMAWLLISVFGMLFVVAVGQKVGWDRAAQNMIDQNPKLSANLEKMPAEQRERQASIIAKSTQYSSYAVPIFVLVFAAITAAVLMGVFNFGAGAEVPFGVALAIVIYSWVPGILKSLLIAITLYAGADPNGFNIKEPLASNLGALVSATEHPALHSLLGGVDVFAIWYVILMGIGFSCVSRIKASKAISIVAGLYLLVVFVGAGWTAVMG